MYRTSPCPHCGVIPDETPDPLAQVEKCLRDRVAEIIRDEGRTA